MLNGGDNISTCFYGIPPISPPASVSFLFYFWNLFISDVSKYLWRSFPDFAHHFLKLHFFLCNIFHQEHMQDLQWLEAEHSWLLVSHLCNTFSSSIRCSELYNSGSDHTGAGRGSAGATRNGPFWVCAAAKVFMAFRCAPPHVLPAVHK